MEIVQFLHRKLAACVGPDALAVLERYASEVELTPGSFYSIYARIPMVIPADELDCGVEFTSECVENANGWRPMSITSFELARLWLLLAGGHDTERLAERLDRLFDTGELSELIVLYRALPLYPNPEAWKLRR